jgi:hypothetical protein
MKLNQVDEMIYALDMSLFRLDLVEKNGEELKSLQISFIKKYINEIKENLEWERTELEKLQQ